MGINISDPAISQAIYQTILAAYTENPMNGMSAAYPDEQVFFTYVWPGKTLKETDYQNPWTPENTTGKQFATESISSLVDPIPHLSEAYSLSGNKVEQIYQFILMASPRSLTPTIAASTQHASLVASPTDLAVVDRVWVAGPSGSTKPMVQLAPHALETQTLERQYANVSANLIANRRQYNLLNPVEKAAWEAVASPYESAVNTAWEQLQEHRLATPCAMSLVTTDTNTTNPVAFMLNNANEIFNSTRLASIQNPSLTYHASYVNPNDFADASVAWAWPSVSSLKVTTFGSAEPNIKISFKFCLVDISRPWLLMNILDMQGWYIEGQAAGSLSNGKLTNNPGSFPLLPESFVVVRDLVITELDSNSGSDIYSAEGLQIVVWINSATPFIPPNA